VEILGVLRCAQDDSKNKQLQQQKQTTTTKTIPLMRSATPASKLAGDPDAAHEWGTRMLVLESPGLRGETWGAPGFEVYPRQIQGSLHCATNDEPVRRFGRDDVLLQRKRFDRGSAGFKII
jgi:hypothetical protein